MRRSIVVSETVVLVLIVFVAIICSMPGLGIAATIVEDFSGGVPLSRWEVIRRNDATGAPWTIDASEANGWLQISKTADTDNSTPYCRGGIRSRFRLVGDFSASVSFELVDFPVTDSWGWNEAVLSVAFPDLPDPLGENFFEVLRWTRNDTPEGQWSEGWSSQPRPYRSFGVNPDPTFQGDFIITRQAQTLSAWIDRGAGPILIGSQSSASFAGPAVVDLLAVQWLDLEHDNARPQTSLDVRFGNLVMEADSIVPEPSTIALLCMGAVGLLAYAWRRRFVG